MFIASYDDAEKKITELLEYSSEATSDSTTSLVEKVDELRDAQNASSSSSHADSSSDDSEEEVHLPKKLKKISAEKQQASPREKSDVLEISNVSLASTLTVPSPTSSHSTSSSNFPPYISHSFSAYSQWT
jgi:hypothetical protein